MEKKMEATIVYGGYIGIMEKKMEATIEHIWGFIRIIEKENGNYYRCYNVVAGVVEHLDCRSGSALALTRHSSSRNCPSSTDLGGVVPEQPSIWQVV